jgi:hypothetical protein
MLAFGPQSSALEIALEALLGLVRAGLRPSAFTHDSFLIEARAADVREVVREARRVLESPVERLDGLVVRVDVKVGPTWGDMREEAT